LRRRAHRPGATRENEESEAKRVLERSGMRASNHPVANKRAFGQALARMKLFLPMDNWPESMLQLFFRGTTLSCGERLRLLTFLVGNGYEEGAIRWGGISRVTQAPAHAHLLCSVAARWLRHQHQRQRHRKACRATHRARARPCRQAGRPRPRGSVLPSRRPCSSTPPAAGSLGPSASGCTAGQPADNNSERAGRRSMDRERATLVVLCTANQHFTLEVVVVVCARNKRAQPRVRSCSAFTAHGSARTEAL
jgi:hypothetical protein